MNADSSQPTTSDVVPPLLRSRSAIPAATSIADIVVDASASGSIGENHASRPRPTAASPAIRIRPMSPPVIRTASACRPWAMSAISRSIVSADKDGRVDPPAIRAVPMS